MYRKAVLTVAAVTCLVPLTGCNTTQGRTTDSGTGHSALQLEALRGKAESTEMTDPPRVVKVRDVDPEEQGRVVQQCAADAGWPDAKTGGEGGVSIKVDTARMPDFMRALYTCFAQYPLADRYEQPPDRAALIKEYTYQTTTFSECLRANGVEPGTPPSQETYIAEALQHGGHSPWSALSEPLRQNPGAIDTSELSKACPQTSIEFELRQQRRTAAP